MKSLADRHEDRARRIAANASERAGNPSNSVATVEGLMREATAAAARLSPEEQDELRESLRGAEDEFGGARSLAEAPDGSGQTMAGIGVVNTKVVPASVLAAEAGNGGGTADWGSGEGNAGWGGTAPATVAPVPADPAPEGNLNGAALEAQTGAAAGEGEGTKPAAKTAKAKAGEGDNA